MSTALLRSSGGLSLSELTSETAWESDSGGDSSWNWKSGKQIVGGENRAVKK